MYYAQEIVSIPISEGKVKANAARKGTLQAEPLLATAPHNFPNSPFYGSTGRGLLAFYWLVNCLRGLPELAHRPASLQREMKGPQLLSNLENSLSSAE